MHHRDELLVRQSVQLGDRAARLVEVETADRIVDVVRDRFNSFQHRVNGGVGGLHVTQRHSALAVGATKFLAK